MNFMTSEYQADAMQYRSKPHGVKVSGAGVNLFVDDDDDDCIPNATHPYPLSVPSFSSTFNDDLCVTPDKRTSSPQGKFDGAKRTVTFNENVDVQLLSPSSSLNVANNSTDTLENTSPLFPVTHSAHTFYSSSRDQSKKDVHNNAINSSNFSKHVPFGRRNSLESLDSAEITQSSEDSLDAIDVIASDYGVLNILAAKPLEHKLARPEFSSILQITKKKNELQNGELNLDAVVKEKLNIGKTRTQLEEKAYQHLNREDIQYRNLKGTEVAEEDINKTEQIIAARANQRYVKPIKRREPDVMEFLVDDFQKETASYSVESFVKLQSSPQAIDVEHAFDVYQYMSSWEGW